MGESGVIAAGTGKVCLLKWSEYDWKAENRPSVWEIFHQMIRLLKQKGENPAGRLLAKTPQRGEGMRQLAYHLYTLCERKKWAEDARAYNEWIVSWYAIVEAGNQHQETELAF